MGRLNGKVAMVTGAARGLGADIARELARDGAGVVLSDILDDQGKEVAAEIGNDALYVHCDVADEEDWAKAMDATLSRFGRLDILVNNAAVLKISLIEVTPTEEYLHAFKVNELGVFLGVRSAIAPMRASGGGSIINISTVDGVRPAALTVCYSATKYAVEGITRVAALELRASNIRVNNVICGFAASEGLLVDAGVDAELVKWHSEGGESLFGMPAAEAQLLGVQTVLFLASDESRSMTGSNLTADFGMTAGLSLQMGM